MNVDKIVELAGSLATARKEELAADERLGLARRRLLEAEELNLTAVNKVDQLKRELLEALAASRLLPGVLK